MRITSFAAPGVLALAVLGFQACGGDDSPSSPSGQDDDGGGGGGGGGQSAATITIGSSGVNPATVTIPVGSRVTFVNNDTRSHQMSSNPHPVHTDCPALNLPNLSPGQSSTSGVLNTARTCGFHDHNFPDEAQLRGSVVIQ